MPVWARPGRLFWSVRNAKSSHARIFQGSVRSAPTRPRSSLGWCCFVVHNVSGSTAASPQCVVSACQRIPFEILGSWIWKLSISWSEPPRILMWNKRCSCIHRLKHCSSKLLRIGGNPLHFSLTITTGLYWPTKTSEKKRVSVQSLPQAFLFRRGQHQLCDSLPAVLIFWYSPQRFIDESVLQ